MGDFLSVANGFANTPSTPGAVVAVGRNMGRSNDPTNSSSTQPNIGISDSRNYQPQRNSTNSSNKPNRIIRNTKKSLNTKEDGKNKTNILRSNSFTFGDSDSDTDSDVDIKTRDGEKVQEAAKNKKASTDDETSTENQDPYTEPVVLKKTLKPGQKPKKQKTSSNALTSKHVNEDPCAPYIKDAVMIYDTIDEAIKTKEGYPYTKLFAQTNKTRKISDRMKDVFTNIKDKLVKNKNKNKNDKIIENKEKAKDKSKQDKEELQESKVQAETDAEKLVDDLLKIDIDKIEPNNSTIIELHIKIQHVEGGAKAYITKLENDAMNMKGGKRGKRTRRKRQPVQKGGNNNDIEKKKKKLKIVNILKQLNSANYIDYEIESIIQELKRLLGQPSTVDTSIPETITTKTTIQEDMYSEPLPVCTKYDENVDKYKECEENRKTLKNRLKYFNKLKELNAMHNDNALVIFAENTFKDNKKTIEDYSKPYAKSDDTTTKKADKDKQYLDSLEGFKTIDETDSTLKKKITKYNDIVNYLNKKKEHIVNPQLDEKLMTTNTKQTVTQSSSLKNILGVEHILNMISKFNMDEYQSTYGNANNMGDPGHKKTSSSTVVKRTDILRKPENNVE